MIINLQITPEETEKILTGLSFYKADLDNLSNRILEDARRQISEMQDKKKEETKEIIEEGDKIVNEG